MGGGPLASGTRHSTEKPVCFVTCRALQASGAAEGAKEVAAMNDGAVMQRYLSDFRFLVDQDGWFCGCRHRATD